MDFHGPLAKSQKRNKAFVQPLHDFARFVHPPSEHTDPKCQRRPIRANQAPAYSSAANARAPSTEIALEKNVVASRHVYQLSSTFYFLDNNLLLTYRNKYKTVYQTRYSRQTALFDMMSGAQRAAHLLRAPIAHCPQDRENRA